MRGNTMQLFVGVFCATLVSLSDFVLAKKKVCQGLSNKLTLLGKYDDHYRNLVRMYSNCSVVLENLEITYIQEHHDLSFLRSIEEVNGYVLIAVNYVESIPLENLRLIRGHLLYENRFALTVMSNYDRNFSSPTFNVTRGLRQLPLRSLTEILRGGVKITHNHLLCNIDTIQWKDIVNSGDMVSVKSDFASFCHGCDSSCYNGSCWAPGPENCQTITKLICADQCSHRCKGPKPIDCCNGDCAGGCTGPYASECFACKDFEDDGICKNMCPPLMLYDPNTHQLIPNPNAKYSFGATCVKNCPHNYVVTDQGACVRTCSSNTFEVEENGIHKCKSCIGPCPKVCNGLKMGKLAGVMTINATNIDSFKNCTKINGDISILRTSLNGDKFTNTPKMDPAKLDIFKTVREITGFLLIQGWPDNLTSLSPFENLEIIRGRTTHLGTASFAVLNIPHLEHLGLRSLREVSSGDVVIRNNPRLCYTGDGNYWRSLLRLEKQRYIVAQNADQEACGENLWDTLGGGFQVEQVTSNKTNVLVTILW